MQIDMHYYGTYVMARCAGLRKDIAQAIATAAEYVDDSDRLTVRLADGQLFESEPTAHHPEDRHNLAPIDQRRTWVPFHFIPGGDGKNDSERLVCRTDSEIAREMVEHNIALAKEPYGALLMGITAHVYSDTFSHYGFSGITSAVNRIDFGSIEFDLPDGEFKDSLKEKEARFIDAYIKAPFADFVARLGHGGVASFPDQPYLRWRFTYEATGRSSGWRDNPSTFLAACERLHARFAEFGANGDDVVESEFFVPFDKIRATVQSVLAVRAAESGRIEAWQEAVRKGLLYPNPRSESIPTYDKSHYLGDLQRLPKLTLEDAKQTLVYLFLQAANLHRSHVLDTLLPNHGIKLPSTLGEWFRDFLRKLL